MDPAKRRAGMGVVFGFMGWFVAATLLNFILRAAIEGYRESEPSLAFTPPMMVGRLLVGVGASLAAGAVCASLAYATLRPAQVLGAIVLLLFLPVHAMLWEKFPAWYHLFFLLSIVPCVVAGAQIVRRAR